MVDVFISYPRAERARAEPFKTRLEALGLEVFFDLEGIDGGANFPDAIDRALRASKAVLCCWSPLYFERPWCMIECRDALARGLLTPVATEPFDAMAPPADLRHINFFDLSGWRGEDACEEWSRMVRSLGQKVGKDLTPDASSVRTDEALALSAPPESADLLDDLRRTWASFPARDDRAVVERFLERVRAAAPGSGLEFEVELHRDQLERAEPAADARTARRRASERPARRACKRSKKPSSGPAGDGFVDPLKGGGHGPEILRIPEGRFLMGSPPYEAERSEREGPRRMVAIAPSFGLGRFAVTFGEYDAYCEATGAERPSDHRRWGRGRRPVINVSWGDAQCYCRWLSEQSGAQYRLPSEAEWEYSCRAGSMTPFWWGRELAGDQANYNANSVYAGGGVKGDYRGMTEPVDAFAANPWGLHQMHGNVFEWCQDCWNESYDGAPVDGAAWMSGDCSRAAVRGGRVGLRRRISARCISLQHAARLPRGSCRLPRGPNAQRRRLSSRRHARPVRASRGARLVYAS